MIQESSNWSERCRLGELVQRGLTSFGGCSPDPMPEPGVIYLGNYLGVYNVLLRTGYFSHAVLSRGELHVKTMWTHPGMYLPGGNCGIFGYDLSEVVAWKRR